MDQKKETGIEFLRRVVKLFDANRESFNDQFSPEQLIQLAKICFQSTWDFYPDQWTERQVQEALLGIAPDWNDAEQPWYHTPLMVRLNDLGFVRGRYRLTGKDQSITITYNSESNNLSGETRMCPELWPELFQYQGPLVIITPLGLALLAQAEEE